MTSLLVKIGCRSCLIFLPRSRSRLGTTSADSWSLNGMFIRKGLGPIGDRIETDSGLEAAGSCGWSSRWASQDILITKNILFKFLNSWKKAICFDDKRFARSKIVLKSDRLHRVRQSSQAFTSTWFFRCKLDSTKRKLDSTKRKLKFYKTQTRFVEFKFSFRRWNVLQHFYP